MKRQSLMLAATAVVALLFLLTLGAPLASADAVYTLSNSNTGLTGPFGTVDVSLTSSTTALVTFTAASGYLFIDSSIADVNVNAGSWTIGSFSFTCASTGCNGGSGNVNGFGSFNQTTNHNDGFASGIATLSFVLTNTSGTWASASNVLIANSPNGGSVAAHLAQISSNGSCTFFASDGTENSGSGSASNCGTGVPDGGMTLMLLGGALVGIETLRRKFSV